MSARFTKQFRITPVMQEALKALAEESGLEQADLADRMLTPVITLVQRYGWYRVIEELQDVAAITTRPRKPGQRAHGLKRKNRPHSGDHGSLFLELLGS
jgi:hypothetical protein